MIIALFVAWASSKVMLLLPPPSEEAKPPPLMLIALLIKPLEIGEAHNDCTLPAPAL